MTNDGKRLLLGNTGRSMLATGVWTLPQHSSQLVFGIAPPVSHMALLAWEVQTDVAES